MSSPTPDLGNGGTWWHRNSRNNRLIESYRVLYSYLLYLFLVQVFSSISIGFLSGPHVLTARWSKSPKSSLLFLTSSSWQGFDVQMRANKDLLFDNLQNPLGARNLAGKKNCFAAKLNMSKGTKGTRSWCFGSLSQVAWLTWLMMDRLVYTRNNFSESFSPPVARVDCGSRRRSWKRWQLVGIDTLPPKRTLSRPLGHHRTHSEPYRETRRGCIWFGNASGLKDWKGHQNQ